MHESCMVMWHNNKHMLLDKMSASEVVKATQRTPQAKFGLGCRCVAISCIVYQCKHVTDLADYNAGRLAMTAALATPVVCRHGKPADFALLDIFMPAITAAAGSSYFLLTQASYKVCSCLPLCIHTSNLQHLSCMMPYTPYKCTLHVLCSAYMPAIVYQCSHPKDYILSCLL